MTGWKQRPPDLQTRIPPLGLCLKLKTLLQSSPLNSNLFFFSSWILWILQFSNFGGKFVFWWQKKFFGVLFELCGFRKAESKWLFGVVHYFSLLFLVCRTFFRSKYLFIPKLSWKMFLHFTVERKNVHWQNRKISWGEQCQIGERVQEIVLLKNRNSEKQEKWFNMQCL